MDLVPIAERGPYFGMLAAGELFPSDSVVSCLSLDLTRVRAFASANQWRWIFYLNLPICAIAAGLVLAFLRVKTPQTTWREKLQQMDWL